MPSVRIGCSGFTYDHWQGLFYPGDIPRRRWFEYYASVFNTVELNVTFYRLPGPETFAGWRVKSPPGFTFAVKGSRFITHVRRLANPDGPVKAFLERAMLLEEKLGPVLWQLPPQFAANVPRLKDFLTTLKRYPVRNVFEFRHESWLTDEVIDLLRGHNAALCAADWPAFLDDPAVTADFVYLRRHGEGGSYATRYTKCQLANDAARIRRHLASGKDVFVYFNNDAFGYAPQNARELLEMV